MLLARMFYFVQSDKIRDPIYAPDQAPAGTSNRDFLQEYVVNLLQSAFKNLQEYAVPPPALIEYLIDINNILGLKQDSLLLVYLLSMMTLTNSKPI